MFDHDFTQDIQTPTDGARRILSVSGGGLLGVIPAAMLMRYEALGKRAYGADYRLCHSFDLVGGTSTGAVVATGVALGLEASRIADFYLSDVPKGFRRRAWRLPGVHDVMDADLVQSFYLKNTQGKCLRGSDLETALCVMTKDATRGRAVALSSLIPARAPVIPGAALCHVPVPLDQMLRASTAVPGLFAPVPLAIGDQGRAHVCIDGGLSPFNSPGLVMVHLARAAWPGAALDMTALGTGGQSHPRISDSSLMRAPAALRLLRALKAMIRDGEVLSDATLHQIAALPGARLSYVKRDIGLGDAALGDMGLTLSRKDRRRLRDFADFRGKQALFDATCRAAEQMMESALPLTPRGAIALDRPLPSGPTTRANTREYTVHG